MFDVEFLRIGIVKVILSENVGLESTKSYGSTFKIIFGRM